MVGKDAQPTGCGVFEVGAGQVECSEIPNLSGMPRLREMRLLIGDMLPT